MIQAEQIRAARALLRLDQDELARRAKASVMTIRRLESLMGVTQVSSTTVDRVRQALEDAGAEFIEHGVRRRRVPAADPDALSTRLQAISQRSAREVAERPPGDVLTESDLYDEDGLPA